MPSVRDQKVIVTKRYIIFVAGVHGVGKGYFCKMLAPEIDGHHVAASELIRNRKSLGTAKAIEGIDANQSILVGFYPRSTDSLVKGNLSCSFNSS